jgi:hypothetical protein
MNLTSRSKRENNFASLCPFFISIAQEQNINVYSAFQNNMSSFKDK